MLADKNSRLHQLWGQEGWRVRPHGMPGCWGDDPQTFFADAERGATCARNWYEGNRGPLGFADKGPTSLDIWPHFTRKAPALLGFDEDIDNWCHPNGGDDHGASCVRSNLNILSLYWPARYNICRNLEWMTCAARGELPGQGDNTVRFASRPGFLEVQGGAHPLGSCTGYHPMGCWDMGYASSDIFYLESCIFATICSNGDEIFHLKEGEDWQCNLSSEGFTRLKDWLLQ